MKEPQTRPARIPELDVARSAALAGMILFHFVRDLEMFALVAPGLTTTTGWALFARLVAGSFLFLVGVSLVLAHGDGVRWASFLRRLAVLAAAAGLVTAATWLAVPQAFIFFGILHSIAVASVLGLAFLRAPVWVTSLAAGAVYVLPQVWRSGVFDPPWLVWTGLAERVPPTLDFEPVFPWLAPCLLGIAVARFAERAGVWDRLRSGEPGRLRRLGWPGRHSLAVYLAHQPVLIALVWVATRIG